MSAPEGFRPPEQVVTWTISKAARKVERLKLRRRALVKKLAALDDEIRAEAKVLRHLVADVAGLAPDTARIDAEEREQLIDRAMGQVSP